VISFLIGCGSSTGTITVVNPTLKTEEIVFDGKSIKLTPDDHFTQKGLKPSTYDLKIGTTPPMKVELKRGRTTLVDIAGENCFIVADYTDQYGDKGKGDIKIIEKHINKTVITTKAKITANLGEELPNNTKGHRKITRIHRIDCAWIDNNQAIIDAIANLP